eukprot:TRINITY_DN12295_c0_g5_i2.p1 TRINITY_DN12295_c0_g5~~TRINITY_DN12295_c0_g5_i2.p1  ORF type:complete len:110 (+),score=21.70 TRINITY_DN12295_c0_g5_i2:408-737(+)
MHPIAAALLSTFGRLPCTHPHIHVYIFPEPRALLPAFGRHLKCNVALQNRANAAARRQAWLGFAGLGFGFGFLYRLTWFDYSWDLMEPVTYFVGLSVNICELQLQWLMC